MRRRGGTRVGYLMLAQDYNKIATVTLKLEAGNLSLILRAARE